MSLFTPIVKGMLNGAEAIQANFTTLASHFKDDGSTELGDTTVTNLTVSGTTKLKSQQIHSISVKAPWTNQNWNFVRVGNVVHFDADITTTLSTAQGYQNNSAETIPVGYRPDVSQELVTVHLGLTGTIAGSLIFRQAGNVISMFNTTRASGAQFLMSGSWITSDTMPS